MLILAGIALAAFAVLASSSRRGKLRARGGAVVIVGPFPIVFGTDTQSAKVLLILAIILVSLLIVLFVLQPLL